ncbi:hypothetical protein CA952_21050 [Raoultella ornithinolytica]|nr:hypothetical protein CA210_05710 [Raoultella ornithinolytica]OZV27157.1 hypothetical protein CA952_21050 [Raoultella ornithinolytica]OZV27792.1 hypothetical protein CA954_22980 [Raoultella ornithinolytica]OZV33975.1 hypothetical protein CA956_11910 [Raoultella ornithinolytica]OZV41919.1 hypothetical protein CA953_25760 [Raoultella ornithinolytica]
MAALVHPSHVLMYAPGDSLPGRLHATRIILGITQDARAATRASCSSQSLFSRNSNYDYRAFYFRSVRSRSLSNE